MDIRKQRLNAIIAEKRLQNDNEVRTLKAVPELSHEPHYHLVSQPVAFQ